MSSRPRTVAFAPKQNVLTLYGVGLSIIEISKVLNMGVGEVKYIIDSNTEA